MNTSQDEQAKLQQQAEQIRQQLASGAETIPLDQPLTLPADQQSKNTPSKPDPNAAPPQASNNDEGSQSAKTDGSDSQSSNSKAGSSNSSPADTTRDDDSDDADSSDSSGSKPKAAAAHHRVKLLVATGILLFLAGLIFIFALNVVIGILVMLFGGAAIYVGVFVPED